MGQIFSNKKSRAPLVWIVRQNHQEQQTNLSTTTLPLAATIATTTGYQQSLTNIFLTSESNNNNKQQQLRNHRQQHTHQKRNSGSAHSDLIIKNNQKMFSEKYIKDFNENTIKRYKLKNKMNKKNYIKVNNYCTNNNNNNANKRRHSFNYQNYNGNEVYNYNNNNNNNNNYIIKEFNLKSIHSEPCLNRYEDTTLKMIKKQQLINNNRKNYQYHFGYNIKNVEDFLSKCSLSSPGNIPVVLLTSCILYQTQNINKQVEIYLPLGMVVNGMFKNQNWLYVKTPHAEEGYICYMACVPLGILPKAAKSSSLANLNTLDYDMDNGNEWNSSKSECGGANNYNLNRNNKINRRKICRENLIDLLYIKTINKEY